MYANSNLPTNQSSFRKKLHIQQLSTKLKLKLELHFRNHFCFCLAKKRLVSATAIYSFNLPFQKFYIWMLQLSVWDQLKPFIMEHCNYSKLRNPYASLDVKGLASLSTHVRSMVYFLFTKSFWVSSFYLGILHHCFVPQNIRTESGLKRAFMSSAPAAFNWGNLSRFVF